MKQTKPFGKAYVPSGERAHEGERERQPERPAPPREIRKVNADEDVRPVLTRAAGSTATAATGRGVIRLEFTVSDLLVGTTGGIALVCVLLALLIAVRDTLHVKAVISLGTESSAMRCIDGQISYAHDDTLTARLMNDGKFVCRKWGMHRSLLTWPRDPHRY